jgi:hypothetical protein
MTARSRLKDTTDRRTERAHNVFLAYTKGKKYLKSMERVESWEEIGSVYYEGIVLLISIPSFRDGVSSHLAEEIEYLLMVRSELL